MLRIHSLCSSHESWQKSIRIEKEICFLSLKNYIEDNKKINLCSDKDMEKIRDYFIQVLSKKISDNFEDLNKERDFKIKDLEEQYYDIPMPTHEDLLKICTTKYSMRPTILYLGVYLTLHK